MASDKNSEKEQEKKRVNFFTSFSSNADASTSIEPCNLSNARRHVEGRVLDKKLLQHCVDSGGNFLKQRMRDKKGNKSVKPDGCVDKLGHCGLDDDGGLKVLHSDEGFKGLRSEFCLLFEHIFRRHNMIRCHKKMDLQVKQDNRRQEVSNKENRR